MYSLIFLGVVSFLFSLTLTPLVRSLARRSGRSGNDAAAGAIPRAGGIAVALAYGGAYVCLLVAPLHGGALVRDSIGFVVRLLPAAGLVFLTGILDDYLGLEPWQKLAGEMTAASAAYWAGIQIHRLAGYGNPPGEPGHLWWSFPVTVVWLVACANAIPLIDGVDGLAAGVALFATSTTLIAALLQHNTALALATVPLAGCLLGFMRYNFSPAAIFLGHCGSLFIGFLLGCYAVVWSQKSATILGMTAPVMALAIPLLDMTIATARRFLRRRPLFEADRDQFHHRLLKRGFTPRKAALVLYGCAAVGAVCSLVVMNRNLSGVILVAFSITSWLGVQHLGYIEFGVAGRLFLGGAFRRLLNSHIALESLETDLNAAATLEDCWLVLRRASWECGFHRIDVWMAGHRLSECTEFYPLEAWKITVPISANSWIEFYRCFAPAQQHQVVAAFVEVIRRVLAPKFAAYERDIGPPRSGPLPQPAEAEMSYR